MDRRIKQRCNFSLLFTVCETVQESGRIYLAFFPLRKKHLRYFPVQGNHKVLRCQILCHFVKDLRIGDDPGQHQFLRLIRSTVLLFLRCTFLTFLWLDAAFCRCALKSQCIDSLTEILHADTVLTAVLLNDRLDIEVPLQFILQFQKHLCTAFKETVLPLRLLHRELALCNTDPEHKAVRRLLKPFLKGFRSKVLDEFIRILIWPQIHNSGIDASFPQDRDCTERRTDTCLITVVEKQDFLRITLQKAGMAGSQCRSKRSHRIRKTCLMHGDNIHISLTEDQIFPPRRPRNIKSVQVTALIKDLGLRGVQILRFAVTHHTSAKTDHTVIDIHDRKDHTVPELIIHTMTLVHIKKPGFPKPVITVALGLKELIQSSAEFVRIPKPELTHRLLTEPAPCKVLIPLRALLCTELIVEILRGLLVDLQKFCTLLCLLSHFSGIFDLGKFHSRAVSEMLQRLAKRIILIFHDKIKNIPTGSAAKTIIHLLPRC